MTETTDAEIDAAAKAIDETYNPERHPGSHGGAEAVKTGHTVTLEGEFDAIFEASGPRKVMSRPPMPLASQKLIDEVAERFDMDRYALRTRELADWLAGKLERYGMWHARPVFGMDGGGPECSLCASIWPLCGCFHYSNPAHESNEGDPDHE